MDQSLVELTEQALGELVTKPDLVKNRTVLLDLRIGNKSFVGSVSTDKLQLIDGDEDERALDPEFVTATKNLINRKAMNKLRSLDLKMRRELLDTAIPNGLYKNGYYLFLLADVVPVTRFIKEYIGQRDKVIQNLFSDDHYEFLINEAKGRLGNLFNQNNYPPAAVVRGRFGVSYQWFPVNVEFTLSELDIAMVEKHHDELEAILQEEANKARGKLVEATQDIEKALAAQLHEVVAKLEEVLTPEADGKPKTLREPMVEKLNQFLSIFDQRNVTNSTELLVLADSARSAIAGVHVNRLRYDDAAREEVRKVFHAITEQLTSSGMVVKTSKRVYAAPDEEV